MDKLVKKLGFRYEVEIQCWHLYPYDYIDVQLIPKKGEQKWIYYHNAHGSTYAK